MITRPSLFGGPANTATRQPELFADDGGHLDTDQPCPVCGRALVRTESGQTCFNGCIGLRIDAPADADEFDVWALTNDLTT